MTPSIPCATCGQVDELETVNPLGIHLDKAVLWNCRCGNTRAVAVSHRIPPELVRKAMTVDKTRDSIKTAADNYNSWVNASPFGHFMPVSSIRGR
jgi:hypothetical protein